MIDKCSTSGTKYGTGMRQSWICTDMYVCVRNMCVLVFDFPGCHQLETNQTNVYRHHQQSTVASCCVWGLSDYMSVRFAWSVLLSLSTSGALSFISQEPVMWKHMSPAFMCYSMNVNTAHVKCFGQRCVYGSEICIKSRLPWHTFCVIIKGGLGLKAISEVFKRDLCTQIRPIRALPRVKTSSEQQHMSPFCGAEFLNVCARARSRPWGKELLAQVRHVYPRRRWERGRQRHLWWQPYRALGILRGQKNKLYWLKHRG